jgi:ABC-type bacteriocin/lantibiotic exporter with double-glycine peptidase domain
VIDTAISAGELLSFYALMAYFTGPASAVIGMNKTIRNAMIAADRLFDVMELDTESDAGKIALTRTMIGDIRFRHVTFRYGTRANLFEGLTMTIPKRQVTALVGESGSGKSTIVNLLQNLYMVTSGEIMIGEHNLKFLTSDSVRKHICAVPQKIDLFAGTIIENIALGDPTPDLKKIFDISSALGILDFIQQLPSGFATPISEQGTTLSGGQRQRLAIARALYFDPEI